MARQISQEEFDRETRNVDSPRTSEDGKEGVAQEGNSNTPEAVEQGETAPEEKNGTGLPTR
jgi:hypothetical protein